MNTLNEFQLGQEAINYIKFVLNGGKTLSYCILKNCNLDYGKVKTCLPPNFKDDVNIFDYNKNILSDSFINNIPNNIPTKTDSLLAQIIESYLGIGGGNVCILEDAAANADAPCMMHVIEDSDTLVFGQEVYYILCNKGVMDNKKIEKRIHYAKSLWHFVCIFTSLTKGEIMSLKKDITEHELNLLAKNTVKIAIGAYAGNGYLIWQKG